jgi:Methyltransferase domain
VTELSSVLEPTNEAIIVKSEPWISEVSYWMPRHMVDSAWLEHAPFAYWLVDAIRPTSIVELGTHNGFSYFVFCEAIKRLGLDARAFALDSWEGDDQAGFYGNEVYESVSEINAADYSSFSTLIRGYFDDGLDSIPDNSVDLLHIDGRHGYDDVRHDFEAWLPKVTDRGVVIFHDIAEHQEGFGVWQFWAEVSEIYPSFAFDHGHGLGVLVVGSQIPERLREVLEASADHAKAIKSTYVALGSNVSRQFGVEVTSREVESLRSQLDEVGHQLQAQVEESSQLWRQLRDLRSSTSWRVTRPLRAIRDRVRSRRP